MKHPGKGIKGRTIIRYSLLQIPGIILIVLLALAGHYIFLLPLKAAIILILLWIIKDIILFPFVWQSYTGSSPHGAEAMVGRRGIVISAENMPLRVRIGMESWQGRSSLPLEKESPVLVIGYDGMILLVEPAKE
jgi:membrane protein implicated in regulation of membrane protease activity